ncbi:MAG: NAD(P)H-dependent oxidoreductase [Oscillospiraceae bacterium]|nr:NAD(P)H-dependent oxidoreductase [Oscillospiraceae bacterium]
MEKILFVNACVRSESRTLELAKHLLGKLDGEVQELILDSEKIPALDGETLKKRDSLKNSDYSDPMFKYAKQFAAADTIIIAAPYWDLMFPALLKIYFEAITVTGITFKYSPEGQPIGLCKAKRLIYLTTAGGPVFDELNLGYDYAKKLATLFYGIPETVCFKAEGLDIYGADIPAIITEAKNKIDSCF